MFVVLLVVFLGAWEASVTRQDLGEALTECDVRMGVGQQRAAAPPSSDVLVKAWEQLRDPFYDAGPMTKVLASICGPISSIIPTPMRSAIFEPLLIGQVIGLPIFVLLKKST
ncbi:MAG: hypothetical protein II336_19920 [Loktanella sp.]|nr:hypothetical protein [Loktanella sp.]